MRIAIIGSGIAGLATAWMLDGSGHDVVLFERNAYAGGHAHTLVVQRDGVAVPADTACSTLVRSVHSNFLALLERLKVATARSLTSLSLYSRPLRQNLLVVPAARPASIAAALRPALVRRLLQFDRAIDAAEPLETYGDWSMSVREYLERLPPSSFVTTVMRPVLAGLLGTSIEEAMAFSARAALKFFICPRMGATALSLESLSVVGGIGTYVQVLLDGLRSATVALDTEVVAMRREAGRYYLQDRRGGEHGFDQVVLAAPAYKTLEVLATLPGTERLCRLLGRIEHLETAIAVHSDPSYMPAGRGSWSYVNMTVDDRGECEKTFWCGMKAGVDVFRSWVTLGSRAPRDLHAMYRYTHPRMTPDYYRAQAELAALDLAGEGLWLAGSYLEDVDTHESGVRSAMKVVQRLHPESPNLRALPGATRTQEAPR